MTQRIKRAMSNPNADILFHPTGRVIHKREAYELDMDEIIETARSTGTVCEVDAYPERLNLKDDRIRKAVQAGVKLAIDSDAHSLNHIRLLEFEPSIHESCAANSKVSMGVSSGRGRVRSRRRGHPGRIRVC